MVVLLFYTKRSWTCDHIVFLAHCDHVPQGSRSQSRAVMESEGPLYKDTLDPWVLDDRGLQAIVTESYPFVLNLLTYVVQLQHVSPRVVSFLFMIFCASIKEQNWVQAVAPYRYVKNPSVDPMDYLEDAMNLCQGDSLRGQRGRWHPNLNPGFKSKFEISLALIGVTGQSRPAYRVFSGQ